MEGRCIPNYRISIKNKKIMAKRIVTKIGNIFCIEIDNQYKRYFQYVANDMSELNSSVIRMFKRQYPMDYISQIDEIVNDEIDFYTHLILRSGIAENVWYKVGKLSELGDTEHIMFRMVGNPESIKNNKSDDWYVWRINCECFRIGILTDEYRKAYPYVGSAFSYISMLEKIRTGMLPIEDIE